MEPNISQQPLIDNSDDEDLPDIFASNIEQSDQKYQIMPGDIVWAYWRKFYWPALVRTVFKKNKKASVWYLDSPRKCFKVSFKKIKNFSDAKISALIRQEVQHSPVKAVHEKVLLNAITFIRRKTEGHKDDPAAYFDLNEPYLTFKDPKFSTQNHKNIANAVEPLEINTDSYISDEESIVSSEEEESELSKKITRFINVEETDEDQERTQAIVDCITAGHLNKYLLRVKNKKTPSEYQNLFEDAMKTDRKKLLEITACEIVKNLQKLKEISFYLLNYYEKVVEGGKCEMLDYVTSVWLPEAINKADEMIKSGDFLSESGCGTRRQLFPSDRLEIEEMPDVIRLSQKDEENDSPSKKTSKKCKRTKKINQAKSSPKSPSRSSPRNLRNRNNAY